MATAILDTAQYDTTQLLSDAQKSIMFIVNRPAKVFVRGRGNYLWDSEGKRYLDFLAGWAVNCLGHSPPAVVKALQKQARELVNASPALYNEPMIRLAKMLTDHSCLDKVFFANSGAEANEGAVKLARKYGAKHLNGAHEVITFWHGFHGRTLAMMSASGKQPWDSLYEPKVPGFIRVELNDLNAVKQAIGPKTCAVMLEPVQGEAGVFPAEPKFVQAVRKLCEERGVPLILDEIQTGYGRLGTLWGYEQLGIEPDIMTLGKGIGGGFPLSALLAKDKFCVFEPGDQGGTYCGQPLAMAAGIAVLNEVLAKNSPKKAESRGKYLRRQLKALGQEFHFKEIRGKGLLQAVDLPEAKGADIVNACLAEGLLINAPRPDTLRFMPALTISSKEIDEMIAVLRGALGKVLGGG